MGIRYALRELERVIGAPDRRFDKLDDGRDAKFKHTHLSKLVRYEFFERADRIRYLCGAAIVHGTICGNPYVNFDYAVDKAMKCIDDVFKAEFPYVETDNVKATTSDEEFIKSAFAELKRMREEREAREKSEEGAASADERRAVEESVAKMV